MDTYRYEMTAYDLSEEQTITRIYDAPDMLEAHKMALRELGESMVIVRLVESGFEG